MLYNDYNIKNLFDQQFLEKVIAKKFLKADIIEQKCSKLIENKDLLAKSKIINKKYEICGYKDKEDILEYEKNLFNIDMIEDYVENQFRT